MATLYCCFNCSFVDSNFCIIDSRDLALAAEGNTADVDANADCGPNGDGETFGAVI